jgi:CelD/BcsL family acetyltransferase involved in cellulose biosynthesis/dTDP-4-amino-4,6-dideoxygalactose transaminase
MPDYQHGSEIEAIQHAGLLPRFYRCTEALEPSEADLDGLLGPRTRALYLIHYYGFPQDSARWRRWCDDRRLLLIEDAAQAWLATCEDEPVGAQADLAVYCLYKTYGLSEGSVSVSRHPAPPLRGHAGLGLPWLARRHGLWLAQRSQVFTAVTRRATRSRRSDEHAEFALRELDSPAWSHTDRLLRRLVSQDAPAARRSNYRVLLEALAPQVPEPFDRLPEGASPFCFPIRAVDKRRVLERLSDHSIKALNVWATVHPDVPELPGSTASSRRATTVGLPVHQELGAEHLERIVDAATARPRRRRRALALAELRDVEAVRQDWEALAASAGNPFATPEWLLTWWIHYGTGERKLMMCRTPAGEHVGILPLYVQSLGPLRTLRFLGHGAGDRLGPICSPEHVEAVAAPLQRMLKDRQGRWDVLLAERLPAAGRWGALLNGTRLRCESSPLLRIRWTAFSAYLSSRSRNFREQVSARERRLRRRFDLQYRLSEDPRRLPEDLATLFALHADRWGGESTAFDGRRQAFHRDVAAEFLRRGWLRLWFLELDGQPVAAWYGFRYAGADWYYQGGRDRRFEAESVGFVLMAHTVRTAIEEGMQSYMLLRGAERYKSRFANRDDGVESFVCARGLLGKSAEAAVIAAAALPPQRRRVLSKLGS